MDFLELTIHVSSGDAGLYRVHATSQQGEGDCEFALPLTSDELEGVVHGAFQPTADAPTPPVKSPGAELALGRRLFQALFAGPVRDILNRVQTAARDSDGRGVRIRLGMDLNDPRMADVACLPWELICDDFGPMATSRRSVIVRAVDTKQPISPPPYTGPLRILVLQSNPEGTPVLNLQGELKAEEVAWAKIPGAIVDCVRPVKSAILNALATTEYHVIHYMGHGGFNPTLGGRLILENEDGTLQRVSAAEFAGWIRDQLPRLVFLNACETGRTPGSADLPPFAGVATALLQVGVPAVIGNQFSVSDHGATIFAETFYQRIVQGFPVDAAVAEGRKAIDGWFPVEWATPVLYMRSPDGRLFPGDPDAAAASPSTSALPTPPKPEPVMPEPSNRNISIGGAVTGSVVQTGDHNVTTLTYTTTTLPPPESVDMAAVLKDLRDLAAQMRLPADGKAARKVGNALDEVEDEIASPTPDKPGMADALRRAVTVLKEADDFVDKAAPLAKLVVSAAGWLGGGLAGPLLGLVGLVL